MFGAEIGAIVAGMLSAEQAARQAGEALEKSFEGYLSEFECDNKTARAYRCGWCRLRLDDSQTKCVGCGAPT